ncbi:ABC transporter permease [Methanimicrococcus blatticola]|uniref:Putative ABC transport system permease protein n=1 Tax=Methanimicrococcus blatticola TaxID=91560 RepID=A0A484F8K4_9EURY|nr:ABC transporter permease [Methanimicrococcus blatticola]MBZ3935133.1 ABC transporter permease [Methanimicrococcus blatticola]MCC2508770.1 ABC transporter permease [Methanimicrococcus blatticola]TDQ71196.1 putative ABC transport system permease protein [Methanimicrococcus blatticola]
MITIEHSIKMAAASLKSSKMRTGLTAFGIIIGISAVIATLTIGSSFTGYFTDQVESEGSNSIMIVAARENLFYDKQVEIVKNTAGVDGVSAEITHTGTVRFANEEKDVTIAGLDEDYATIMATPIYDGTFLTDKDSYVAIVGKKIAQEKFENEISVRSTIQITLFNSETKEYVTETFRVKGIIGSDTTSLLFEDTDNTMIVIPSETMKKMTGEDNYQIIYAKADSPETINETAKEIEKRLARNLGVSERDLDDDLKLPFSTVNQAELLETIKELTDALQLFLVAIGGISLVVGAVGIMNIMIVTVTERTKEIGTLKALGYAPKDILSLFIIESVIISLAGGLAGTVVGLSVALIGTNLLGMSSSIPVYVIFIGIGLSVFVGVAAGAQPSYRAAKMNPIDALRDI